MELPPGKRFAFWIAVVCRAAREAAGESQSSVARMVGVQPSMIHRFENAWTWPRNPEQIVAAYALVAGIEDSRDLWEKAISYWKKDGTDASIPEAEQKAVDPISLDDAVGQVVRAHESGGRKPARTRRGARAKASS